MCYNAIIIWWFESRLIPMICLACFIFIMANNNSGVNIKRVVIKHAAIAKQYTYIGTFIPMLHVMTSNTIAWHRTPGRKSESLDTPKELSRLTVFPGCCKLHWYPPVYWTDCDFHNTSVLFLNSTAPLAKRLASRLVILIPHLAR